MADEKTQANVPTEVPPPKKEEGKVEIHPNTTDTGSGEGGAGGVKVEVKPGEQPPPKPEVKVEVKPGEQQPQQSGSQVQIQPGEGGEKPNVQIDVEPSREPAPGTGRHDTKTF